MTVRVAETVEVAGGGVTASVWVRVGWSGVADGVGGTVEVGLAVTVLVAVDNEVPDGVGAASVVAVAVGTGAFVGVTSGEAVTCTAAVGLGVAVKG
jgi:hypothetical protein